MKLLFIGFVFVAPLAQACVSTPEKIVVPGSSFEKGLELAMSSNCGFYLGLQTAAEKSAANDNLAKAGAEKETFPRPQYTDTQATAEYYRRMEAIDAKYSTPSLSFRQGKICLSVKGSCVSNLDVNEKGKKIAIVEVQGEQISIKSVNADGKAVESSVKMVITKTQKQSATIEVFKDGQKISELLSNGERCTRSAESGSGELVLKPGKKLVQNGGGCQGSFSEEDLSLSPAGKAAQPAARK